MNIILHNDFFISFNFIGLQNQCEKFRNDLKEALKNGLSNSRLTCLRAFVNSCTSEWMVSGGINKPSTGLGSIYGYPGDAYILKDKSKMRLWAEYLRQIGQNLTLVKLPNFFKLVRVGLPNRLRGEIWELSSGSMHLRWKNPGEYERLQAYYTGQTSLNLEEIEKDLMRNLPEYPGYQVNEGIDKLRIVLATFSWKNKPVGYCQAMNIVVAALLIFQTEEQTFWMLNMICDIILPGYYSLTMYGALLDQRVFEDLMAKTMPILWEHFKAINIQLNIVSLPWCLSLFINSMPMIFSLRIIDCFFMEGARVLFQVALAILRINGEILLDVENDGAFIDTLKVYFSELHLSAHPKAKNPKLREVTKFRELMVIAFKEFSVITAEQIIELRAKHKTDVVESLEAFAKRTQLRSMRNVGRLSKEDLCFIYDRFYGTIFNFEQRKSGVSTHGGKRMDYDIFRYFLMGISAWANEKVVSIDGRSLNLQPAEHSFIHLIFENLDYDNEGSLSLNNVVTGIASLKYQDLMHTMSYWFDLYDFDKNGILDQEGILQLSKGLIFVMQAIEDTDSQRDNRMNAVADFIRIGFQYTDNVYKDIQLKNRPLVGKGLFRISILNILH